MLYRRRRRPTTPAPTPWSRYAPRTGENRVLADSARPVCARRGRSGSMTCCGTPSRSCAALKAPFLEAGRRTSYSTGPSAYAVSARCSAAGADRQRRAVARAAQVSPPGLGDRRPAPRAQRVGVHAPGSRRNFGVRIWLAARQRVERPTGAVRLDSPFISCPPVAVLTPPQPSAGVPERAARANAHAAGGDQPAGPYGAAPAFRAHHHSGAGLAAAAGESYCRHRHRRVPLLSLLVLDAVRGLDQ